MQSEALPMTAGKDKLKKLALQKRPVLNGSASEPKTWIQRILKEYPTAHAITDHVGSCR